ncbi:tautomerase family protein [Salinivibrio sp. ES.052]|uniref:tautomerase family protein n=1 Tax=Salinivibrio sp. ES.052 TaxID=1882823 RepID=UPI00092893B6|nr:tautomerase family protein [Salinivibrio sp. ES.052]SIN74648.1 Tautomerase enzyme [Salinivibrio sp. ES.052]
MPMTRISLGNELFEKYQHQISHILQQCLEAYFDVSNGDCFQIFAGKSRDHEQKRALYKALCEQLQVQTPIGKEDIMIIIQFNSTEDWSFSSGQSWKDEMETIQ